MALLDKLREQYGVRPVCSELHIAPSTYYHCQQQRHHPDKRSARAQRDDWLKKEIQRVPSGTKIWLVAGITDMRNGFNGLAAKVQTALKDDPMSGHVFIFRGRSGSQVKLLWSTGDGLCLLTKRLERGRFAWPSARDGKVFLTQAQLAMLLEGIDWRQPKRLLTSLTML